MKNKIKKRNQTSKKSRNQKVAGPIKTSILTRTNWIWRFSCLTCDFSVYATTCSRAPKKIYIFSQVKMEEEEQVATEKRYQIKDKHYQIAVTIQSSVFIVWTQYNATKVFKNGSIHSLENMDTFFCVPQNVANIKRTRSHSSTHNWINSVHNLYIMTWHRNGVTNACGIIHTNHKRYGEIS